ncbi:MAG: phospholipase C, phosphocholine-specific [Chitinophagaceae bacterium]
MNTRREFVKKSLLLSGAAGLSTVLPASIQKAFAIDPETGSTFLDAEHIVILMQENRSFDHCFGTLRGVRGFNDPRALTLPDQKPVWLQSDADGRTYSPFRLNIKDSKVTWMGDLPHSRHSQVDAYNNGKYDQWLKAKRSGNKKYADVPLTLGYYKREDLPFNYAMADAFTVCDQNFCSAMTSTTPNRSFFWTGKITNTENNLPKANIRNDDYDHAKMDWQTFPELLQENNISWKFYQNELDCGGGFKEEERAWLSNFGCNLLEFFKAYNVKFSPRYVEGLQKIVDEFPAKIKELQDAKTSNADAAEKNRKEIVKKQEVLNNAVSELKKWNKESFEQLTDKQKSLYRNAFVVNDADPSYRSVTRLKYNDGTVKRELAVPEGDILHQFRKDVEEGKLPTVSWFAGPQNFSDHPSAPWYGAWYVSEILDILTKNPAIWKKTIFILTYDENDGYFDHVPPFSIPDNIKPDTGKCSAGIETEIEHVRLENELKQGIPAKQARGAAVGLGYRVPMIIASPWSRGGKVCSQLFDHTSTLQFLEVFLNKKFNKNIHLDNISRWRRTICGDLTAAFSPFDGSPVPKILFLDRNPFVEDIYSAQFRQEPSGYQQLTIEEIDAISKGHAKIIAEQEKGTRPSCSLPYELLADCQLNPAKKQVEITMVAGNKLFGDKAAGSPFTVYAPGKFTDAEGTADISRIWSFAVAAGDRVQYAWPVDSFENGKYHLRLYGPNGFYRQFRGSNNDPALTITCEYEMDSSNQSTGNIIVVINAVGSSKTHSIEIKDNAYRNKTVTRQVSHEKEQRIVLPLAKSNGWYDFTITANGEKGFEKRYAGRVETGKESSSDPFMGRVVV